MHVPVASVGQARPPGPQAMALGPSQKLRATRERAASGQLEPRRCSQMSELRPMSGTAFTTAQAVITLGQLTLETPEPCLFECCLALLGLGSRSR